MPIQFSNIVRCASFWIALIAVQLVFPLYAADQVTRRSDRARFRGHD
jgi:hypothetical protein